MKTFAIAALSAALAFAAALDASAQTYPNAVQTYNTYGGAFTVTQNDPVTKHYSAGAINNTNPADTLETLSAAGNATIAFDTTSSQQTLASGTLAGLADSVAGSGGANGETQFNNVGANTPKNDTSNAPSVVDFTFNDPAAPNGETLNDLGFFTLSTGAGYGFYDLDIAYSTNGVTFTKFLSAQDALGNPGTSEQLFANNFNNAITGVKALQMTLRTSDYGYNSNGSPNTYQVGTWAAEFDVDMTPTPAPAPEPSQTVAFGLGVLGLAALAFSARKRRVLS